MKPATGSSILAAALIVSLVSLSPARALADELPKDTNRIERLTPEQAKAIAGSPAWNGDLSSIVAFKPPDSVEIAATLAKRKGPLSLPNLKKLSPKTLTALIEKEDVEIPLIATLELIQEPDGSPTEDFMIPKGFQSRQKRRQQGR